MFLAVMEDKEELILTFLLTLRAPRWASTLYGSLGKLLNPQSLLEKSTWEQSNRSKVNQCEEVIRMVSIGTTNNSGRILLLHTIIRYG